MRKLLIGIGAIVVLLIAAALVAPLLIPTDAYKSRIIALVKQSTGRDLTIAGPVKLTLLPQLEIEASGIALANAPGAHDPDMVRLKQLEVQLRLLPLLHGAVELGRFVLTEPVIALEIDKDGRPNWVFAAAPARPAPPAAAVPPAPRSPAASGTALSGLGLEDVRLAGGTISYRDDRSGATQVVDAIDMALSLPDLDSPFSADGAAVWHDQKVALTIAVAKPRALLEGGETGLQMKLAAAPITFGFAGAATGLPPAKLSGTIDLTVPSIRGLATWTGAALPPGGGLGPLSIKGKIGMAGPRIAFDDAEITLDAMSAKGAVAVVTGGVRPALTGNLQIDKLDLNPYLPPETASPAGRKPAAPAAGGSGGAAAQAASAGWSDAPLDLSGLAMADADFDLQAGAILYRKIAIGPSALDLHLKDGTLAANLSRLSLYEGQGQAKVTVDGSAAVPAVALTLTVSGLQIGPLLAAAAGFDRLSGTGTLSLDVAGSGASERALVGALAGKGALDLANGSIKGVNLIAMAENAGSALTGISSDNKTDFGSLTGTYTIAKGIVKNDDLQLKSGVIPITGAGTVNLPSRTVDYRVTVSLAGAIGVPVLISGPWDRLSYRPDLAKALQGVAKQPGELLDQLKSGAGSNPAQMLKNLFGH